MNLRYCMLSAHYDSKEDRHPQEVMKELGITYQHATPQSIADQWWFWNCENAPSDLPEFLREINLDPMECIGHGLSLSNAELIRDYNKGQ